MPESAWRATIPITVIKHGRKFGPNATTFSLKHHELTVVAIKQMFIDGTGEEDILNDPIGSHRDQQPQF